MVWKCATQDSNRSPSPPQAWWAWRPAGGPTVCSTCHQFHGSLESPDWGYPCSAGRPWTWLSESETNRWLRAGVMYNKAHEYICGSLHSPSLLHDQRNASKTKKVDFCLFLHWCKNIKTVHWKVPMRIVLRKIAHHDNAHILNIITFGQKQKHSYFQNKQWKISLQYNPDPIFLHFSMWITLYVHMYWWGNGCAWYLLTQHWVNLGILAEEC